ncbi:MAG: hypothetical protein WKG00_36560 [Polyangiaceae bacterium]
MSPQKLRRLVLAPELLLVDLTDAGLVALRQALRVEHPTVDAFPAAQGSQLLCQAARVLRAVTRLRRELTRYRAAVDQAIRQPPPDDFPF